MGKLELRRERHGNGELGVYDNGIKVGTASKEGGIPFISSDQVVGRDFSGRRIAVFDHVDEGVVGGLLGHTKTVVQDLRKKPSNARYSAQTASEVANRSQEGFSGSSGHKEVTIGSLVKPLRLRTKLAIGTATVFLLGALAVEYINPHRVYGVFKAADDVVEVIKKPFQESYDPSELEKEVKSTEHKGSGGRPLTTVELPTTILLKDGRIPYHPNCVGKERTREVGEWSDGKPHCQGYALGKWNNANMYPGMQESNYFCWNPAPNGTGCGENRVCLEGLCRNSSTAK